MNLSLTQSNNEEMKSNILFLIQIIIKSYITVGLAFYPRIRHTFEAKLCLPNRLTNKKQQLSIRDLNKPPHKSANKTNASTDTLRRTRKQRSKQISVDLDQNYESQLFEVQETEESLPKDTKSAEK